MFESFKKQNLDKDIEGFQKEKMTNLERVREKAEKFLKRVKQSALILSFGMAVNYTTIHSNEVETIKENGKEIFRHPDKETTHILNYLSGIDSLSDEEQVILFKNEIKYQFSKKGILIPENYDEMNKNDFFDFLNEVDINHIKQNHSGEFFKNLDVTKEYLDSNNNKEIEFFIPKKYEYNDTLNQILWDIEKECGSPKIEWTSGQERNTFQMSSGYGVSHYNPVTHTVFINCIDGAHKREGKIHFLLEELSHSKQFHDNYLSSIIGVVESTKRIATDIVKTHDPVKSQLKEYNISGSLENDAHKIIEPYLKKKFDSIKKFEHDRL